MNGRLPARSYATKSIPLVCLARKAMPKYTQGSQEEAVVYLPTVDRTNRRNPSGYATCPLSLAIITWIFRYMLVRKVPFN